MPKSNSSLETIAILSPGDMGHAVGRLLREHEVRVLTCLYGRSPRTKMLSEQAGITDVPTMKELVEQSDLILSITVSEAVPQLCQEVADAIAATRTKLLFAECNAISPQLSREMESLISATGSRYVDASIIGGPPRNGSSPRFYASGSHAAEMEGLKERGLDVRVIGPDTGQASGIKMCYAAMTKGTAALFTELLMAAEMLGLSKDLLAEFQSSQPAVHQRMEGWLPGLPAKANRWVSEMQEIEATFDGLGLTPLIFQGVADMYRLVGSTSMGEETPENRDENRSLGETIQQLAAHMKRG
ncbi:MAG: 6-phosphogluconate dehydrogenase [SAR202 cluster bacterium Io17-Chloro-G4]|nr:MAG: 6-phosphogluconate dehydrogenase [SAR202 cluster bacterium Io17-Chloro-G4]